MQHLLLGRKCCTWILNPTCFSLLPLHVLRRCPFYAVIPSEAKAPVFRFCCVCSTFQFQHTGAIMRIMSARTITIAVMLLLACPLFASFLAAPNWDVTVVDSDGHPVPNISVTET